MFSLRLFMFSVCVLSGILASEVFSSFFSFVSFFDQLVVLNGDALAVYLIFICIVLLTAVSRFHVVVYFLNSFFAFFPLLFEYPSALDDVVPNFVYFGVSTLSILYLLSASVSAVSEQKVYSNQHLSFSGFIEGRSDGYNNRSNFLFRLLVWCFVCFALCVVVF